MTEYVKDQLTISLTRPEIDLLRELSLELGIKYGSRGGNISGLMRFIANRYAKGDKPFRDSTLEESIFSSMYELAESLVHDLVLREEEATRILRIAAKRRYSGLESHLSDNIILDIVSILFGEKAP